MMVMMSFMLVSVASGRISNELSSAVWHLCVKMYANNCHGYGAFTNVKLGRGCGFIGR